MPYGWLKLDDRFEQKPDFQRIKHATGRSEAEVGWALYKWLARVNWLGRSLDNDRGEGILLRHRLDDLPRLIGLDLAFWQQVRDEGWFHEADRGLVVPDYDERFGTPQERRRFRDAADAARTKAAEAREQVTQAERSTQVERTPQDFVSQTSSSTEPISKVTVPAAGPTTTVLIERFPVPEQPNLASPITTGWPGLDQREAPVITGDPINHHVKPSVHDSGVSPQAVPTLATPMETTVSTERFPVPDQHLPETANGVHGPITEILISVADNKTCFASTTGETDRTTVSLPLTTQITSGPNFRHASPPPKKSTGTVSPDNDFLDTASRDTSSRDEPVPPYVAYLDSLSDQDLIALLENPGDDDSLYGPDFVRANIPRSGVVPVG